MNVEELTTAGLNKHATTHWVAMSVIHAKMDWNIWWTGDNVQVKANPWHNFATIRFKFLPQLLWLIVDSKVYWYRVTLLYPDIDECAIQADGTRSNNCHTHAACSNRVGSYSCSCNVGYQGNGQTCYGMFKLFILPNMSLIDAFVWLIYAYVFAA